MYMGAATNQSLVELTATLSIRNVSAQHPLVLSYVRYYDSAGKKIRDYVSSPSRLQPLASVEFVIEKRDTTGGPGASFLVQWAGASGIDEPLIEAIMVGQSGNAGISFTGSGRNIENAPLP
jgi:hypothetical protein